MTLLRDLQCECGQGFFFCKPVGVQEILRRLENEHTYLPQVKVAALNQG